MSELEDLEGRLAELEAEHAEIEKKSLDLHYKKMEIFRAILDIKRPPGRIVGSRAAAVELPEDPTVGDMIIVGPDAGFSVPRGDGSAQQEGDGVAFYDGRWINLGQVYGPPAPANAQRTAREWFEESESRSMAEKNNRIVWKVYDFFRGPRGFEGCQQLTQALASDIMRSMRLREWAEQQGVSYITAWRWHNDGRMPVPSRKVGGVILVDEPKAEKHAGRRVVYARVSSADQRADLDRQVARAVAAVGGVDASVTEVGSAMNGARRKFRALLADPEVAEIVVEHRDRAARFGFEYIEAALSAQGRRITVLDDAEVADDLVRDMTEVLTSFCARLYGKRAAANRARRAVEAAAEGGSDG